MTDLMERRYSDGFRPSLPGWLLFYVGCIRSTLSWVIFSPSDDLWWTTSIMLWKSSNGSTITALPLHSFRQSKPSPSRGQAHHLHRTQQELQEKARNICAFVWDESLWHRLVLPELGLARLPLSFAQSRECGSLELSWALGMMAPIQAQRLKSQLASSSSPKKEYYFNVVLIVKDP